MNKEFSHKLGLYINFVENRLKLQHQYSFCGILSTKQRNDPLSWKLYHSTFSNPQRQHLSPSS